MVGEEILADAWNLRSWHVREDLVFLLAGVESAESRAVAPFTEQAHDYLARSGPQADAPALSGDDDLEGFGEPSLGEAAGSGHRGGTLA